MKRIISLIISIIAFVCLGFSQHFSMDYERFYRDFNSNLNFTGEIRPNGKSMSKEFGDFWASDTLNNKEKDNFIKITNLMASKGCKPSPDFVCVTDNLMLFKRKNISSEQYDCYIKELNNMLNDGKRPNLKEISEYLTMINSFIANDIILKNMRTHWKAENNQFTIKYDKEFHIVLQNINLVGYQGKDSLKIYNTNGKYFPARKHWEGKNGIVGWERVGYKLDDVKAELNNYSIDLRSISFTADSAVLTNNLFFKNEKLLGLISDKTGNIEDVQTSHYPRFSSYQQHFELNNIFAGASYEGGFSMRGKDFIGSGTKEKLAKVTIQKNDSINLVARSDAFFIDEKMIASQKCAITLHLGEDSIYHPNLTFRYHGDNKFLELIRSKDDMSQVNYVNSYHNISMDFTWMRWPVESEKIEFNTFTAQQDVKEALFESLNFYTLDKYRQMRKRDPFHPLEAITNFVKTWAGLPEFYLQDLSSNLGYSKAQILQIVLSMAYQGFLSYDPDTEFIKVYPSAWEFMEAHRGTKDSDVIQFQSRTNTSTANAELSLLNFDLKINGIPEVHLSDSQNVRIYPIDKKIILKKNLKFSFNGTIQAGQFYYYGSNFEFDYDRFMIELTNCDSMKMVAATDYLDDKGNPKPAIVRSKLEQINGQFYIDDPLNKSGRKDFPQYPRFTSLEKTYVYYDRQDVYNKIYKRDNFYFEVDPFELDSIQGYDRENLRFKGTLYSGGIFPPIKETLVLRTSDFSLGFKTATGPVGLPLYDGRATYWNEIDLSNQGLRGAGKIDYITSSTKADYLIFFPDKMEGHAQTFEMTNQKAPVEYPTVKGRDNTLNWYVSDDQFNILKRDSVDFNMFDKKAVLDGDLCLTTTGLSGKGAITMDNARVVSKLFTYKKEEINADTSDFAIYTQNILNIDFDSKNVQSKINFDERQGKFKSNGKLSSWRFPKNKYRAEMSDMTWLMDKKELEANISEEILAQIKTVDAEENPEEWESLFFDGPKFTSTHYLQDSLYFFSPKVVFDYEQLLLTAEDVKFIRVADAAIYTNNENIVIEAEAIMRSIMNSKIIANTTTKYHAIYNAVTNISSRNSYTAYGDYDYISVAQTPQKIHFGSISVNANGETQASGKLTEDQNFTLSPYFGYQGDIKLYASNKNLEFIGGAKIIHDCEDFEFNWLKFKSFIDPEDIYIPVDTVPFSINQSRLSNGLVLSNTNQIYPAFMKRKGNQFDQDLFSSYGYLTYDHETGNFMIASKERLDNPDTTGNYLRYNKFLCSTQGEGKFELSKDFGLFKPNVIGSFEHTPGEDSVNLFVSMLMEAHFNRDAQKLMADKINATGGLDGISLRDETYEKAVYEYLGTKLADEWFSNLSMGNYNRIPRELADKFSFVDLNFVWHKNLNSFIHHGPIGIANVGREQINRYVFGFIRIEKSRRGDLFEMLIEPSADTWYYFRYSAGTFSALSSDETFNSVIYETKPNQRELKVDGLTYQYGLGSSSQMKRFKTDMYRTFKIDE